MAEVRWVKITVDMFDNRKIRHLRKLPEGNNIVLIWVMLLTMAGRCNANGMVFLTENIPYTAKMLADELDFEETTVVLALQALARLNMIIMDGDFFCVAGWEEIQNIEGMERIRESIRVAQAKWRAKQKMLTTSTVDSTEISRNKTDIDIEKDKEIEKEKEIDISEREYIGADAPPTLTEVESFCRDRGDKINARRFFDYYSACSWKDEKGQPLNWKQKAISWEATEFKKKPQPTQPQKFSMDYSEQRDDLDLLDAYLKQQMEAKK